MNAAGFLLVVLLAGCSASGQQRHEQSAGRRDAAIARDMQAHDHYLATENAIEEALNRPAGPDYTAAIAIAGRSDRAPMQKEYDIGGLQLSACRDRVALCSGPSYAAQGIARLTRVATTPGEDSMVAAGDLAMWYTRGAGSALMPNAAKAACWTAVRDGKADAASCADSGVRS